MCFLPIQFVYVRYLTLYDNYGCIINFRVQRPSMADFSFNGFIISRLSNLPAIYFFLVAVVNLLKLLPSLLYSLHLLRTTLVYTL